jgi:hypothetical protein
MNNEDTMELSSNGGKHITEVLPGGTVEESFDTQVEEEERTTNVERAQMEILEKLKLKKEITIENIFSILNIDKETPLSIESCKLAKERTNDLKNFLSKKIADANKEIDDQFKNILIEGYNQYLKIINDWVVLLDETIFNLKEADILPDESMEVQKDYGKKLTGDKLRQAKTLRRVFRVLDAYQVHLDEWNALPEQETRKNAGAIEIELPEKRRIRVTEAEVYDGVKFKRKEFLVEKLDGSVGDSSLQDESEPEDLKGLDEKTRLMMLLLHRQQKKMDKEAELKNNLGLASVDGAEVANAVASLSGRRKEIAEAKTDAEKKKMEETEYANAVNEIYDFNRKQQNNLPEQELTADDKKVYRRAVFSGEMLVKGKKKTVNVYLDESIHTNFRRMWIKVKEQNVLAKFIVSKYPVKD